MSGSKSRDKGNRAMRDVVKWLKANGYPWVEKRESRQAGDDIIGFPDVSIEVKDHKMPATAKRPPGLGSWVDQATGNAGGRFPVVWHKRADKADVADWYSTTTVGELMKVLNSKEKVVNIYVCVVE
jgi:hypothetical protein